MKKVLFIIGSLRAKSFNRQLADVAEQLLAGRVEVERLDISDVPLVNQDKEFPAPEAVDRIRKAVSETHALWIFTPEYNGSYPGMVKNALDWLSRPLVAGDYATPTCIAGKVVAISGAGGKAATAGSCAKLTELLTFIRAEVLESQTGVVIAPESWATDVLTLSDEQREALRQQAEALIAKIEK
ncbi:MAG: NAD(P)H-dependent oxidoreductase [Muribaculaceae bacterium]|nr:NAD(P)H-dependent oxidoreductase [Muribaculaceae bacterium]